MTSSQNHHRKPIVLILDFDGTLTTKDTTEFIGKINHRTQHKWPAVVQGYMSDYETFEKKPFEWKNYDAAEYSQWLDSRNWIEGRSFQRAHDSGLFDGVTREDVQSAVEEGLSNERIVLRDGWLEMLGLAARIQASGGHSAILSVSWSGIFIRECLSQAVCAASNVDDGLQEFVAKMDIHANEIRSLDADCGQISDSQASETIRTSGDKLERFKHIIQSNSSECTEVTSIYVGDSATDFGCLSHADIGVWIQEISTDELEAKFANVFSPLKAEKPASLTSSSWEHADSSTRTTNRALFSWAPDLLSINTFLKSRS